MRMRLIERWTPRAMARLRGVFASVGVMGGVTSGLALGLAGCGAIEPITPYNGPTTDPTQLYMSLTLDHPAVNLSTAPGYNTLQLTATPHDVAGNPMTGLPAPTFTSSDTSRITVTASGLVTALKAGSGIKVTAALTAGPVQHTAITTINVATTTTPPGLASLSIHPVPPDSAVWPGPAIGGTSTVGILLLRTAGFLPTPKIVPHVLDTLGNPITGLQIEYTSLDPAIATFQNEWSTTASITGLNLLRPGKARLVAKTTAYGIAKADTVAFTVTYPIAGDVTVRLGPRGTVGFFLLSATSLEIKEIHLVTNGILFWTNNLSDSVDVTFDDPTNVVAPPAAVCALIASVLTPDGCGTGNIMIPPKIGTTSTALLATYRARQFPVPGVYHYHSARTGTSVAIVVNASDDFID